MARGDRIVSVDRRLLLLILAILLVILGIGIGGLPGGDDSGPSQSPDITLSTPTPTPTPTPPGGGGGNTLDSTGIGPDEGPSGPTNQNDDNDVDGINGNNDDPDPSTGNGNESTPFLRPDGESSARIQYGDLAPGDGGREVLIMENTGNGSGNLSLTDVDVRANEENGFTEPESAVDNTSEEGELAQNLLMTLKVNGTDDSDTYLYETGSEPRNLTSLGDEDDRVGHVGTLEPGDRATIVVDWHVPSSTGNEIQSDSVTFDLTFTLKESVGS